MLRLIKLELRRINLRNYLITTLILCIVLLAFTYFVANVAQIEQEEDFMNYQNILRFSCGISILMFGIFSAIMYNHLVIKEYSGKRLALLFSYPVSRKKTFSSKVVIVFSLVLVSMLLCIGVPIAIFLTTEAIMPIVPDTITTNLLLEAFQMVVSSVLFVSVIGALSMGIGFARKSITVTLISAFILSAVYGNVAIGTYGNVLATISIVGISLIAVIVVLIFLSNKINHMEVD